MPNPSNSKVTAQWVLLLGTMVGVSGFPAAKLV